jgi:hypothetical protein
MLFTECDDFIAHAGRRVSQRVLGRIIAPHYRPGCVWCRSESRLQGADTDQWCRGSDNVSSVNLPWRRVRYQRKMPRLTLRLPAVQCQRRVRRRGIPGAGEKQHAQSAKN